MAILPAVVAGDVAPVGVREQTTAPAAETIAAGQYVRLDPATGRATLGNATSAAEARRGGIALNGGIAGETITFVRKGLLDLGDVLDTLGYDADVFLSRTDGRLDDALDATAGTVSLVVGTVVPGWGTTTPDKLLRIDL